MRGRIGLFDSAVSSFLFLSPTEDDILRAVAKDRFFGVLKCSVRTPESLKEKIVRLFVEI